MTLGASWRAALAAGAVNLVVGANLPYLPVWMEQIGSMSGAQIAGAGLLATLIRVVAGPLAAGIAQARGLRATLAAVFAIACAGYGLLFPDAPQAVTFLVCVMIYSALNVAGPLFEAILVYGTRDGRPDYGEARAFASMAFVAANLAGGAILGSFGPQGVHVYLVAAAALAALAPLYTKQGARSAVAPRGVLSSLREGLAIYRDRALLRFILAAALIQASHGAYYAFASNLWIGQGIDGAHIGALWATGVVAEIILLALSARLPAVLTPERLLWMGGLGALLRWVAAGFIAPVAAVYVFQTLHAASFALTHLATMRLLAQRLADDRLPLAYAINGAVLFGPLMALSGIAAGFAYDALSPHGIALQTKLYLLMVLPVLAGLWLAHRAGREG